MAMALSRPTDQHRHSTSGFVSPAQGKEDLTANKDVREPRESTKVGGNGLFQQQIPLALETSSYSLHNIHCHV